jgi:hypothetical protein
MSIFDAAEDAHWRRMAMPVRMVPTAVIKSNIDGGFANVGCM